MWVYTDMELYKDMEFSLASGFSRGLIKNNVEFSGCDQEKIMWNFPGS